jgi:hypothetical protein
MDAATVNYYAGVQAICSFYESGVFLEQPPLLIVRTTSPTSITTNLHPTSAGKLYQTTGAFNLGLFLTCNPGLGFLYYDDPFDYIAYDPATNSVQICAFDSQYILYASVTGRCWVSPDGSYPPILWSGFATTTETPRSPPPFVTIGPDGQEVLPGQQQTFTATITPNTFPQTVTWSIDSTIGTIVSASPTTSTFTAPTNQQLAGASQTITVKACSTNNTSICGTTSVFVPSVSIVISGNNPFLATAGAIEALIASVNGPEVARDVSWDVQKQSNGTPSGPGTIAAKGFDGAMFTAPTPAIAATANTPSQACLKDATAICGTADV